MAAIQRVPVSLLARTSSPLGLRRVSARLSGADSGGPFHFAQIKVKLGHFGRFP